MSMMKMVRPSYTENAFNILQAQRKAILIHFNDQVFLFYFIFLSNVP